MRKNTLLCLFAAALLIISTIGTAFARLKVVNESVHEIDMANVKARIIEEYEHTDSVYPGNTIDKVVHVKNTGNCDLAVRVKVEKTWGEMRSEDGKLIIDDAYPANNININYNTEYWEHDAADGYFYYKGVLKPDETTLAPLFKEFSIDKAIGNDYKSLEADIAVKMECVQAAANGISVWNKSFADLGIVYSDSKPAETMSTVTFVGGKYDFIFNPDSTDLFVNFKKLLPGETRSQTIQVKNTFKKGVEIFLRAEDINQSFADPETLEFVNKLLREHAAIIITNENGEVIYSGPVWGEPYSSSKNPASMRYDINLGEFMAGDSKKLNIQFQLDPAMGNEYQNLLGLIKWVWSAEFMDSNTLPDNTGMVTLSGSKTWQHGANPVKERPEELIVYVKANGNIITTQTVTAADHWNWSFELPRYDENGSEIIYTIGEEPIPGYTAAINGNDIINTHDSYEVVTVNGSKTWDHGRNLSKRPTNIVVHVKNKDEIVASKRITAEDNWQWSFILPKYDEYGDIAVYTVEEESMPYYTLARKDGYNLTNKFKGFDYAGDVKAGDHTNLWVWAIPTATSVSIFIIQLFIKGRKKKAKTN